MPHNSLLPLFLLLLLSAPAAHAGWPQPILLKDTFPGHDRIEVREPVVVGDALYFVANDGINGSEIWKSGGSPSTTAIFTRINPDNRIPTEYPVNGQSPGYHYPNRLTPWGSGFFFVNFVAEHGEEVWFSDGTTSGTQRICILGFGGEDLNFGNLFLPSTEYMYICSSHSQTYASIHRTDGTPSGTTVFSRNGGSELERTVWNDAILLSFSGETGSELYRIDAKTSEALLLKEINTASPEPGNYGASPRYFTLFNNMVYFVALQSRIPSDKIYKTDGTAAGTVPVTNGPAEISLPSAYFGSATLYKRLSSFINLNNRLIFLGRNPGQEWNLWSSDGTSAGTRRITNFTVGNELDIRAVGNRYMLFVSSSGGTRSLWRTDGTATGTWMLNTTKLAVHTLRCNLAFRDFIIFIAQKPAGGAPSLWITDGTPGGITEILSLGEELPIGNNYSLCVFRDRLYFLKYSRTVGSELYSIALNDLPAPYKLSARDWTGYD